MSEPKSMTDEIWQECIAAVKQQSSLTSRQTVAQSYHDQFGDCPQKYVEQLKQAIKGTS